MNDTTPRLMLHSYQQLVRDLPTPDDAQAEAFCKYVAKAHSWYKHLSILPPGRPFVFFLDPAAGLDRSPQPDGSWTASLRLEQGFHHAAIPTKSYRDQYGYLAFASDRATGAGRIGADSVRLETGLGPTVIGLDGRLWRIPIEIEEGAIAPTGLIHPYANQPFLWEFLARHDFPAGTWPEESGGDAVFSHIQARCRAIQEVSPRVLWDETMRRGMWDRGIDATFADLVEPDRQRQRRLMRTAIERVLMLAGHRTLH